LQLIDPRTSRVILTVAFYLAIGAFVWAAHKMLFAFLFAIFFAYLVGPLVEYVGRFLKLSRGKSIAVVYLVILGGLAILFLFLGPRLVHEGERLAKTFPDLYEKIATGNIAFQIGAEHGWSRETSLRIQQFMAAHRATIVSIAQSFGAKLAQLGQDIWLIGLIPILAVFFLKDGAKFGKALLDFFERRRQREFVDDLLTDIHLMLAQFIRAQLTLSAIAVGVYTLVLWAMRVPYGVVVGVISGTLEFLPVVGPLAAAILIVGVALGAGYSHVLFLLIFLGLWRVVQDYVIAPRVMGRSVQLHPLASIFGVLVGGEIGGIVGVYLSIPIMASLRIFWRRWQDYSSRPVPAVARVTEMNAIDRNRIS
jgi:predicted PurR-regulated permease PerM